jgi:hypothetical protein
LHYLTYRRRDKMTSHTNYNLPAPLNFWDKYGRTTLTLLIVLLFVASLAGYIYLNFFSESLDVTETLIRRAEYDVVVIHQASVRPGQTECPLTVKLVPKVSITATIPVTVSISELSPTYVVMYGEQERVFVLPTSHTHVQTKFDVVNTTNLPDKLKFRITVTYDQFASVSETLHINVSRLSIKRFALISTLVTGVIGIWLFIGQEVFKSLLPRRRLGE